MTNILLTGGTGYIGSHIAVAATKRNCLTVLFDDFSNSNSTVVDSIGQLVTEKPAVVKGNVLDTDLLINTITDYEITEVIHLAGLKSVEESVAYPARYKEINVGGSESVIKAMEICGIYKLIFSSSATVYGEPEYLPIDESHKLVPMNPYAEGKIQIEQFLESRCNKNPNWKISSLRYFNPVGSHESGLLGDNAKALKANLMPMIARVVMGDQDFLEIYGNDYDTRDGTCLRDYIHIMDLAEGHMDMLNYLEKSEGYNVINLGTGTGISVLELVKTFEKICDQTIPIKIVPRRDGDVPICYADCFKANQLIGWQARRSLEEMCESTWRWCQKHL